MKKSRYFYLLVYVFIFLSGCTNLFHNVNDIESYTETVTSILITEDTKKMVILGADYHYVFVTPEKLKQVLSSPIYNNLSATISTFRLIENNEVLGNVYIKLNIRENDDTDALFEEAKKLRLYNTAYEIFIHLRGERFKASSNFSEVQFKTKHTLNSEYTIKIDDYSSFDTEPGPSPVTVGVKGIIKLGTLPLAVVGIVPLVVLCTIDCDGLR